MGETSNANGSEAVRRLSPSEHSPFGIPILDCVDKDALPFHLSDGEGRALLYSAGREANKQIAL